MTGQDLHRRGASNRDEEGAEPLVRISEMFVGVFGHDLRNSLNAISTAASLLSRRAESDAIAKPVKRILIGTDRMARMLDQLLDFTRIHLGQGIPIERGDVDLSEICRVVIDESGADQGCSIRFEQAGDLVGFWDGDRLSQLLSTVVRNACQHRRAATPVLVRADGTQASMVMLEVWNDVVIPEHLLPVIFSPSEVGTGKSRKDSSALGLGLHISQQIVFAHGGTIRVESCDEKGTRFVIGLPRHST